MFWYLVYRDASICFLWGKGEAGELWRVAARANGSVDVGKSSEQRAGTGRVGDAITLLRYWGCSWRSRLVSRAIDRAVPRVRVLTSQTQDPESSSSLWLASALAVLLGRPSSHIFHMRPYSGTFGVGTRIV